MDSWDTADSGFSGPMYREAVRTAEQTVSDAWIGRLLLAESEAEAVVGACARARERAAAQVRTAQQSGDLPGLARSQTDLEQAHAAWGQALAAHEHASGRLSRELATWSESTAHRVRQALSERSGAGRW